MTITFSKKSIESDSGTDSTGKNSFTELREYNYTGDDTIVDLMCSTLYPKIGDCHDTYTAYGVESIDPVSRIDVPKKMYLKVKFSKDASTGISYSGKGRKPWENPPSNISYGKREIQVPLNYVYDPDQKKMVALTTSAGTAIIATTSNVIRTLSFDYNVQYNEKKGNKEFLDDFVINKSQETVCGKKIEEHCGKLYSPTSTLHTVYKENGKDILYQYETIHVEIEIDPATWLMPFLNVSTFAKFTVDGDEVLQPIYQYSPWTSKDDTENIKIKPRFGSIDEVIKANNAYQKAVGDKTKKIPWSEVTEPMPLLLTNGHIDTEAIEDHYYKRLYFYEREPGSWNFADLPKSATNR